MAYSLLTDNAVGGGDDDLWGMASAAAELVWIAASVKKPPLTIGLFGGWGTGKTSLLSLVREQVLAAGEAETVWFDAWQFRDRSEVWPAFVQIIVTQLSGHADPSVVTRLKDFGRSAARVFGGRALQFATHGLVTSSDVDAVADRVADIQAQRSSKITVFAEEFDALISDVLKGRRLVVLVDDLDRCDPKSSLEILEGIKIFLNSRNCIFVVALDAHSFGEALQLEGQLSEEYRVNYLEKLIQVVRYVPSPPDDVLRAALTLESGREFTDAEWHLVGSAAEGNPRRAKRFVNMLVLTDSQGMSGDDLLSVGRLLVIRMQFPYFFAALTRDLDLWQDLEQHLAGSIGSQTTVPRLQPFLDDRRLVNFLHDAGPNGRFSYPLGPEPGPASSLTEGHVEWPVVLIPPGGQPMTAPLFAVGLDLGDAESAVAFCPTNSYLPSVAPSGRTVPTAIGRRVKTKKEIETLIGMDALTVSGADQILVNFKTGPDPDYHRWEYNYGSKLLVFAEELLAQELSATPCDQENTQLVIGCPASWEPDAVARYELLFKSSQRLPQNVVVVPESRSALVQCWAGHASGRKNLLKRTVVVIDIGSSTVDITTIADAVPVEDPSSTGLGLYEIDEAILAELVQVGGSEVENRFERDSSHRELTLYLCRLRKEQEFGKSPDDELLRELLHGRDWLSGYWSLLERVRVRDLFGTADGSVSWSGRFAAVLSAIAERHRRRSPLIIVTGGGASVDILVDAIHDAFPDCDIESAPEAELAVAMGLAEYGRMLVQAQRFTALVLAALESPQRSSKLRQTYPGIYRDLSDYYMRHQTEGIWAPMSALWTDDRLKLSTHGDFRTYALSLFRDWTSGEGQASFHALMESVSQAVQAVVDECIDDARKSFALTIGNAQVQLTLPLEELFSPWSPGGKLLDDAVWAYQRPLFLAVDKAPPFLRKALGGRFMEIALKFEERSHAFAASVSSGSRSHVPQEISERLDVFMRSAVASALTSALEDITILLLRSHLDSFSG